MDVKKKKFVLGLGIITLLVSVSACSQSKYPDLSDDGVAFYMGSYVDTKDDDSEYATMEYEGRTYMLYGTVKNSFKSKDVDECIGYVVQDENSSSSSDESDTDTRVYTLVDDSECNYLMVCYVGDTLMNQPDFWRAIDTLHKDISTPEYIESLGYSFWE